LDKEGGNQEGWKAKTCGEKRNKSGGTSWCDQGRKQKPLVYVKKICEKTNTGKKTLQRGGSVALVRAGVGGDGVRQLHLKKKDEIGHSKPSVAWRHGATVEKAKDRETRKK